MTKTGETD